MDLEMITTNWRLPYVRFYKEHEQDYKWQVVIQLFRHRIFVTPSNMEVKEMETTRRYGAIACGEKCYRVARLINNTWEPVYDIREFNTFEEAATIAQECATGKHNCHEGEYINMS